MTSLLSTGKKKAKASRVFGGEVFDDAETSLWYSPSPNRSSKISNGSVEVEGQENPTPVVLFGGTQVVEAKQATTVECEKENSGSNVQANDSKDLGAKSAFQSIRNAELSRLRAAKSPLRRDLAEKTQAAINNATSSVNNTLKAPASTNDLLNASRKAKKAALKDRSKQAKAVRFQWDEDRADAKAFYNKVEENRRQLLAVQRQIASAHFQDKARKQEADRLQRIADLDKELEFNSEVFRDHQQKLKEERDRNRKKSIDARTKLRVNKRVGEEKLDSIRRQEEAAIFDVRSDLHRARQEAKKANADARRKSFQFRAGDAKRIRDIRSKWQQEELTQKQQSFELTRAAARDVDSYKKQLEQERRESLQNRRKDAQRRRIQERDDTTAAMNKEHESYELKWAGERDADAYHKKMQEERRKSLASRNKESFRHAQVMKELRALNIEKEAESFMLKFAADNDVKAYLKKLADERRESLKMRGQEAKRQRQYENEQHREAVESALKEGILQSECQNDIEKYKREMAEKARKSLEFRGKESRVRRLEEENQARKQQAQDHQSFELDSLARMDVEEYIKDCKKRRRKSLAFRAKERRRHAEWKRRQEEKEIQAQRETGHLQSLDYQYMALAQQQERARIAMDALRSAGCKIKGNPFGDLLGNL